MFDITDAYDLWEARDREQNEWLERLPVCSICGYHIQQETAFHHDGIWICDSCYKENQEEVNTDG